MGSINILSSIADILALEENPKDQVEIKANGYNIYIKVEVDEDNDIQELEKDLTSHLYFLYDKSIIQDFKISPIGNNLIIEVKWQERKS